MLQTDNGLELAGRDHPLCGAAVYALAASSA